MLIFLAKGRKSLKFGKGQTGDTAISDPEESVFCCCQRQEGEHVSCAFLCFYLTAGWSRTMFKQEN